MNENNRTDCCKYALRITIFAVIMSIILTALICFASFFLTVKYLSRSENAPSALTSVPSVNDPINSVVSYIKSGDPNELLSAFPENSLTERELSAVGSVRQTLIDLYGPIRSVEYELIKKDDRSEFEAEITIDFERNSLSYTVDPDLILDGDRWLISESSLKKLLIQAASEHLSDFLR